MIKDIELELETEQEYKKIKFSGKQYDENVEQEIYHKIMQEKFLKLLEDSDIDLKQLINKKNKTIFYKFNYLIKDLHETKESNICDSLTYLEDLFDYKVILKQFLNSENKILVKKIMREKYNIKKRKGNKNVTK